MSILSDCIDLIKANITEGAGTSKYSVDINTIDASSNLESSGADHHSVQHACELKFDIVIPWDPDAGGEEPTWKTGTVQTVVDSVTAKL
jgi:hypothetical protein